MDNFGTPRNAQIYPSWTDSTAALLIFPRRLLRPKINYTCSKFDRESDRHNENTSCLLRYPTILILPCIYNIYNIITLHLQQKVKQIDLTEKKNYKATVISCGRQPIAPKISATALASHQNWCNRKACRTKTGVTGKTGGTGFPGATVRACARPLLSSDGYASALGAHRLGERRAL